MPELLDAVRAGLHAVADLVRAPQMQAYMKSEMPYLGVTAEPCRTVFKRVFADFELDSADHWRGLVLELWRGAEFREERYAALSLCGDPRARPYQRPPSPQLVSGDDRDRGLVGLRRLAGRPSGGRAAA